MLAPFENDWSEDACPRNGATQRGRLKQTWRNRVPTGRLGGAQTAASCTMPRDGAMKMWWQRGAVLALPELRRVLHGA